MKKTIMVVDDEEDIRSTLKTVLEQSNYKVILAVSGDDCLKKLKTETPDLILMDIMMPGTPTRNVITKIKDIKVSFLSVVRTSEAEKEELIKQKNVVDFIQKPFDIEELIKRVKKLVGE
jgi:DNA-binding response OmpR family regulator